MAWRAISRPIPALPPMTTTARPARSAGSVVIAAQCCRFEEPHDPTSTRRGRLYEHSGLGTCRLKPSLRGSFIDCPRGTSRTRLTASLNLLLDELDHCADPRRSVTS